MNNEYPLSNEIKDRISIVTLLRKLGYTHKHKSGKELIYISMLRDNDTNPSLSVNDELGVWFDHGGSNASGIKGGDIIDFGRAYWSNLNFKEVLKKILEVADYSILSNFESNSSQTNRRPRLPVKLPHYKIEQIKDIGGNLVISQYLKGRGILEVAPNHLKEIYYYVEDEKKLKKHFFSAGWQNEKGGWELRNKYFKGCLGHKGITLLQRDKRYLVVFEGYFNFLSWLKDNPKNNSSVLVLNSLSNLELGIKIAKDYLLSEVYFDLDDAGKKAFILFSASVKAKDCSNIYLGYNDYNEMLIARMSKPTPISIFADLEVPFSR